jgi:aspartyl aminopeptidase
LAIHLNRDINEKFGPNKENHLVPMLATGFTEKKHFSNESATPKPQQSTPPKTQTDKHHALLIDLIRRELNLNDVSEIYDLELSLCDTQPAQLGGALNEFIFGGRLDNQVGSYCTIKALIESCEQEQDDDGIIRMAALYDHEEIGSESATGAASALTEHVMRRLCDSQNFELACARSFMISSDQAHAVHPNYADVHEENHRPSLNGGVVLKYNGNQRYATNSISASILRECAKLAQVHVQDYMVRNDSTCGSTIGPILSAKLGLTTVDIGAPQLSMHSCRETGSTLSITQMTGVLRSFYSNYSRIKNKFF